MVSVSDEKQFNSRIDRELAEKVGGLDMSNREAMESAFQMLLRAHGMTDEESLKDDIREIDRGIQRIRRDANEEIAELVEQREKLVETLEWRQNQQDHVKMTIREIAEGLHENPRQNLYAYMEQVEFLIAHSNGPHDRMALSQRLDEYASEHGLHLQVKQLYPDQWADVTGGMASADGAGEPASDDEGMDYDGFNYGDGDSE